MVSTSKTLAPNRFRDTFGRYSEDIEIGHAYEHRPRRTIAQQDGSDPHELLYRFKWIASRLRSPVEVGHSFTLSKSNYIPQLLAWLRRRELLQRNAPPLRLVRLAFALTPTKRLLPMSIVGCKVGCK